LLPAATLLRARRLTGAMPKTKMFLNIVKITTQSLQEGPVGKKIPTEETNVSANLEIDRYQS